MQPDQLILAAEERRSTRALRPTIEALYDGKIIRLIGKWLNAGIVEKDNIHYPSSALVYENFLLLNPVIFRGDYRRMTMRELFRLNNAAKGHPSVNRWFSELEDPLGTIAIKWFEAIRQSGDDVSEVLHDGHPTACVDGAAFAYVNSFKAHVNIGFFQGSELPDSEGMLEGSGKFMRHVKLRPGVKVNATALSALIQAAYVDVKARLAVE